MNFEKKAKSNILENMRPPQIQRKLCFTSSIKGSSMNAKEFKYIFRSKFQFKRKLSKNKLFSSKTFAKTNKNFKKNADFQESSIH